MAGKVQHEIPRLFLRGFLIPGLDDAEQVYVYRKGKAQPYRANIDRVAAEGYFYSQPSTDGAPTLDDAITDYERRLLPLVQKLRAAPLDTPLDSSLAAEVIAHLTTRNAHLRGAFAQSSRRMADAFRTLFGVPANVAGMLGLDENEPGPRFHERFAGQLADNPLFGLLGLPPPLLERVAFFLVKEGFTHNFATAMTGMQAAFDRIETTTPQTVRVRHVEALSQSLVPAARVESLDDFAWRVVSVDQPLVLPDCVALAFQDGHWHPLIMSDLDEVEGVLMPLSSNILLLGQRPGAPDVEVGGFNEAASACSHAYFICGADHGDLASLLGNIGARSMGILEKVLHDGVQEMLPSPAAKPIVTGPAVQPPAETPSTPPAIPPSTIQVTFHGVFDPDTVEGVTDALRDVVAEASWTMPLDRLDGITFADDYPAALQALDRGFGVTRPLETYRSDEGEGVAQSPTVLRDGVVKGHLVLKGDMGRALLSKDEAVRKLATHLVARQLAQVACTQVFDETLPGILLKPFADCGSAWNKDPVSGVIGA